MSFARLASKRGDLLGVVESAGGMNTPLALFGVREAFVTLTTEGRLGITFSSRSFSHLDNSRCMGGVTYVHTYTCVIIIPKFSNTTSVGKNWKFNQVRGRFTLPPSSFFLNYALLTELFSIL